MRDRAQGDLAGGVKGSSQGGSDPRAWRAACAERNPAPDILTRCEELHLTASPTDQPTASDRGVWQDTTAQVAGRRRDGDLEAAVHLMTSPPHGRRQRHVSPRLDPLSAGGVGNIVA